MLLFAVLSLLQLATPTQCTQCYDNCAGRSDFEQPDYRRQWYQRSNCFCDRLCNAYGDCCGDAAADRSETLKSQLSRSQFTCGPLLGLRTPTNIHLLVYYVDKCPAQSVSETESQRNCRQLCESEDILGDASVRLPVHTNVQSSNSRLVFKNRHCAICNGVQEFISWNIAIECDDAQMAWKSLQAEGKFNASAVYSAWLAGDNSVLEQLECNVYYTPKSTEDISYLPFCKKAEVQEKCARRTNSSLENCRSAGVAYRYKQQGMAPTATVYRNDECGHCAGVYAPTLRHCHPNTTRKRGEQAALPLTILFDMVKDAPVRVSSYSENSETHERNLYAQESMDGSEQNGSNRSSADGKSTSGGEVSVVLTLVCISVSIVALVLQIVVIIWTGSHRRSFGSLLMLFLCGTLIGHYTLFFGFLPATSGSGWCVVRAVLLDVTTKCVFLWMQVLIFDILRAMWPGKSSSTVHDSVKRADQRKRLLKYCAYVYGAPWLFAVPGLVIDAVEPSASVAPLYGARVCYYNSKYGLLLFQYVPMCVAFAVNLTLCALTIKYIRNVKKMNRVMLNKSKSSDASDKEAKQKEAREQTLLYLRLILLAGVTWVFALINAFWGNWFLAVVNTLCNGLLGLFVALSFMCTRAVRLMLRAKLCATDESVTNTTQVQSSSTTISRHKDSLHDTKISNLRSS